MTREQVKEMLSEVFAATFGPSEAKKITEASQAKDVKGWDSLGHITLLEAIESKFGLQLSFIEVSSFQRVGDIVDCLMKRLADR